MWYADWLLSLPLLFLTTLIHAYGLLLVRETATGIGRHNGEGRGTHPSFVLVIGGSMLFITWLHAMEAGMWALIYLFVGAMPNMREAMLYSMGAMTTFGHADIHLADGWQMLGVIESLNGVVLFGLTTATLLSIMESIPVRTGLRHRSRS